MVITLNYGKLKHMEIRYADISMKSIIHVSFLKRLQQTDRDHCATVYISLVLKTTQNDRIDKSSNEICNFFMKFYELDKIDCNVLAS